MLCQGVADPPCDAVASWQNDEELTICLRPIEKASRGRTNGFVPEPVYQAGTSGAVWAVGGVFCKAKARVKGMETEADTLGYVLERFDHIPMPETVYDWVDETTSRSFLIMKPARGENLQQAWPSLSDHQRSRIASQVADYREALAGVTSDTLTSATGCGIRDQHLSPDRPLKAPAWRPIPFPSLGMEQARAYLFPLDAGTVFHFYHADLGPTNIMVSQSG